jgi:Superinfection immunity protein
MIEQGNPVVGLILLGVLAIIYFIPLLVAEHRQHRNTLAICMTNLFLGWTFLGWIAALIWACTDNTKPA